MVENRVTLRVVTTVPRTAHTQPVRKVLDLGTMRLPERRWLGGRRTVSTLNNQGRQKRLGTNVTRLPLSRIPQSKPAFLARLAGETCQLTSRAMFQVLEGPVESSNARHGTC